ncbi:MAG: NAD(P)/FAD-dependent oxidoreductase [Hyphomicrobiales bacterium]|nr:NAD(P)/FAD-dependent oxidoreductase [Hyphomicrobiales bacterium]
MATPHISRQSNEAAPLDALVVGAGFAGLYMLHKLRGMGFSARVLEAGSGVGGTWYWNRYPGARCDVESMEYSYQFSDELQQDWDWTERYAAQPEILRYANHVADRFDLRRDITFGARVSSARFDETDRLWTLTAGDGRSWRARFCIMATGCLSSTNTPDFTGIESYRGATYHTGAWPHEGVDFTDKTVGIIGTGSSAVQSIPIIAAAARHLTVFQRTPNYVVPAHNRPLDPDERRRVKADYAALRAKAKQMRNGISYEVNQAKAMEVSPEEREWQYELRWQRGGLSFSGAFMDTLLDARSNEQAAEFIRRKIRAIVKDAATADLLSPRSILACKRLCVDTGYFETFNRANVSLVDVSAAAIERLVPEGVVAGGKTYALDAIVFATGFDAMTGALDRIEIRGRSGERLKDAWSAGPRTYLGLQSAGFPNLFLITGPGSPSVLTNMLPSIEQHVEFIADCMAHVRQRGADTVEALADAQEAWVATVNEVAGQTLFLGCNSWYLGANVPGKPRVFMPYIGFPPYVEKCREVVAKGYEGFAIA